MWINEAVFTFKYEWLLQPDRLVYCSVGASEKLLFGRLGHCEPTWNLIFNLKISTRKRYLNTHLIGLSKIIKIVSCLERETELVNHRRLVSNGYPIESSHEIMLDASTKSPKTSRQFLATDLLISTRWKVFSFELRAPWRTSDMSKMLEVLGRTVCQSSFWRCLSKLLSTSDGPLQVRYTPSEYQ